MFESVSVRSKDTAWTDLAWKGKQMVTSLRHGATSASADSIEVKDPLLPERPVRKDEIFRTFNNFVGGKTRFEKQSIQQLQRDDVELGDDVTTNGPENCSVLPG